MNILAAIIYDMHGNVSISPPNLFFARPSPKNSFAPKIMAGCVPV